MLVPVVPVNAAPPKTPVNDLASQYRSMQAPPRRGNVPNRIERTSLVSQLAPISQPRSLRETTISSPSTQLPQIQLQPPSPPN